MTLTFACGSGDNSSTAQQVDGGGDSTAQRESGAEASEGAAEAASDAAADANTEATSDSSTEASSDALVDGPTPSDGPTTLDGAPCEGGVATVTKVDPIFGWTGAATPITITGSGFVATPKVWLRDSQSLQVTPLAHAAFVSSTSMSAIVPAGVTASTYDVAVVDPDQCAGWLLKAFTVVANPPPTVLDVSPATGTTQADVNVTITGCQFPSNSTVSTVDSTGAILVQTAGAASCSTSNGTCADSSPVCKMSGTIQTKTQGMAPGAYVVRVTNPTDKTWGDWASLVVTTPDGKLNGGWITASTLVNGRRSLGVVAGRIDQANRFLYAIGGEDKNGTPYGSVEVAPLDEYGQTGTWFVEKDALNVARSGLAVARQGRYLYAIGGTSSTAGTGGDSPTGTPLASIERAVILDPAQAPALQDPPTAGSVDAGGLAKGTWYYVVSAVMAGSDADNPNGETLPSDEVIANLTSTGTVTLSWTALMGAAHYRVYRSASADGTSGSEVLLKDNVTGTTFTDNGSLTPTSETPKRRGSTGVWQTLTTQLLHARLNTAATLAPDPSGALHLYLVGGWGSCTGAGASGEMNCYEFATINTAGNQLGTTFVADAVHTLISARQRHGVAPMTAVNGPSTFAQQAGAGTAFILVGGGHGIASTGNTVEVALVGAAGLLGAWSNPGGFALQRDGSQMQIANGYAYQFLGGSVGHYSGTSDLSTNPTLVGPDGGATGLTFGNWSNAGANLGSTIGRHGVALESAYFYVVGGTTDDTDALQSVYQIIY
jgi:hypothetical protein